MKDAYKLQEQLPVIKVDDFRTGKKVNLNWDTHSHITDYTDGTSVLNLSAEDEYSQAYIADYYGEFRTGLWINPKLKAWAEKRGMFWEWRNPAVISLYKA